MSISTVIYINVHLLPSHMYKHNIMYLPYIYIYVYMCAYVYVNIDIDKDTDTHIPHIYDAIYESFGCKV